MRAKFAVVAVLLVLAAISAAQASDWLGAVSFPLWSERETSAEAGINFAVTFHAELGGPVTGAYKNGVLQVPVSSTPFTKPTAWMSAEPSVLGIEPEHILGQRVTVDGDPDVTFHDDGRFWLNMPGMREKGMLHELVFELKQNQSRKDQRILFFIKHHSQLTKDQAVAMRFITYDITDEIEYYCQGQFGRTSEEVAADKRAASVAMSAIYWPLTQTILVEGATMDYSIKAQSYALSVQGFAPPMSSAALQPDPAIAVYQQQVAGMQATIQALTDKVNGLNQPALAPAPAPKVIEPATIVSTPELPAETFSWRLVLPPGDWRINVSRDGHEQSFPKAYHGTIEFSNEAVRDGAVMIQLIPATGGQPTTWRAVKLAGSCTIDYQTQMKEVLR